MKAYEFVMSVQKDGKITFPEELLKVLPRNEEIRGILLVQEVQDKKFKSSVNDIKGQEYSYYFPPNDAVYDDF